MIVAISTSSPMASVALLKCEGTAGRILWAGSDTAPGAASGACLRMLNAGLLALESDLADVHGFVADIGPGSFTGVRVGVTLAKTLALACQCRAAGVFSFDLVDPERCVLIPSRKGEYLRRVPGETPVNWEAPKATSTTDAGEATLSVDGCTGYGPVFAHPCFPLAEHTLGTLNRLEWIQPEALLPAYLVGPSISTPKRAYGSELRGG